MRVVAQDVGGNFGTRNSFYPEFALVAWAARRLRRPVKWTCTRREAFLTDYQAPRSRLRHGAGSRRRRRLSRPARREHEQRRRACRHVRPAQQGAGAVDQRLPRCRPPPCAGAPCSATRRRSGPIAAPGDLKSCTSWSGSSTWPRAATASTAWSCGGATWCRRGRCRTRIPSASSTTAATTRRRRTAPWRSATGPGSRRAASRRGRRGRYRGIGIANYIEIATGAPRERAQITVRPEGVIDVVIGTLSAGQGHETSFAQLIVEWFGVEVEQVRLITGDTDLVAVGGGSHSGRSMRLGGVVMAKAADQIVEQGPPHRRVAARGGGRGHRVLRAALHRQGHRPLGRSLRGRGRRACAATLRRPCADRSRRRATRR